MIILPAIDIKDGQCVRLFQGDYAQVTTYASDSVQVAQRWQEAGASWLHVVDLDGAARGQPVNLELIGRIRESTTLHIEVGGGMRELKHIEQVLALGIERVILGTVALTNRQLLEQAVRRWGERIAVGLDARNGWVATAGWRETSKVQATDLARELCEVGVSRFIYTDIARDGALTGPNLEALRQMQQAITSSMDERQTCSLIASGGVSSMNDLRALAELGVEGTIVGKALYTGDVDLARALTELEKAG